MGNLYQFSPQEDYDQALLRFMQAELLSWDRIESDSFGTRLKGLVTGYVGRLGPSKPLVFLIDLLTAPPLGRSRGKEPSQQSWTKNGGNASGWCTAGATC